MSRPKFLDCIMTVEVIQSIRSDQEEYDRDPERWERREACREEERLQEKEREEEEERKESERYHDREQE